MKPILEAFKELSLCEKSVLISLLSKISISTEEIDRIDNELNSEAIPFEGGISIGESLLITKKALLENNIPSTDEEVYKLVMWPQSQEYMDEEWFDDEA